MNTLRELTAGEIRVALARKRVSAAELARRVGWSQAKMARRVDGRVALDMDDLEAIAKVLGVTPASLLPGTSSERPEQPTVRYPGPSVMTMIPCQRDPHQPDGRPRTGPLTDIDRLAEPNRVPPNFRADRLGDFTPSDPVW